MLRVVEGAVLIVDVGIIVSFVYGKILLSKPFQPDKCTTSFFLPAREERSKKGGPFLINYLDLVFFIVSFVKFFSHYLFVITYMRLQLDG